MKMKSPCSASYRLVAASGANRLEAAGDTIVCRARCRRRARIEGGGPPGLRLTNGNRERRFRNPARLSALLGGVRLGLRRERHGKLRVLPRDFQHAAASRIV